jgi:nicotinamidase-related amidase
MPTAKKTLHHEEADKSSVALLLIDVINPLEFEEGEDLLAHALPMARNILKLKERATQVGIPTIYVNDNFGRWRSNFYELVAYCLENDVLGKPVVELLKPAKEDFFVLKPMHSGFFATPLELLLNYLTVQTLIITGMAGDYCVLFTANDAYMRNFKLFIPADCVASEQPQFNAEALSVMNRTLKAETKPSTEIDLKELVKASEATQA